MSVITDAAPTKARPTSTRPTRTRPTTTVSTRTAARRRPSRPAAVAVPRSRFARAEQALTGVLARHSVTLLRVCVGVVFLFFGVLKYFPGASPAQDLVEETVRTLTLGLIHGTAAMELTAVIETTIAVTMISGRFLRIGLTALLIALIPILSPLVLFPHQLFPGGLPTLTAQYVFKDIVLAAAALVVLSRELTRRQARRTQG